MTGRSVKTASVRHLARALADARDEPQERPRVDPAFEKHVKASLDEMFADMRALARTPVDVGGSAETDVELDDHLSLRLGLLLQEAGDDIASLADDLRAYYMTRFFEWEILHDGPDAILDAAFSHYLELVGPAYRHLGLDAAAEAFDRFVASPPAQRLLSDPELLPTERELGELSRLFDEIGEHDADRIAFVRARPEVFSV